jgi:branched-chain amino acid aminotransferase
MKDLVIERRAPGKEKPPTNELGFGRCFSDHMFLFDYDPQRGWHAPRIVPYGPLQIDPAASALHYGQALFEGLKAFRGVDGKVRLFQPQRHAARLVGSAERLCMPNLPAELFMEALLAFMQVEKDWTPAAAGTSLYLRPTMIGTEAFLGVRAATQYCFFLIASPVGAYYQKGISPINLWVEEHYVRAARGGVGAAKTGANYVASLLAADHAKKRGYDQVLWLDAQQHELVEEAGTMNAFVLLDDELVTPPLQGSILPGVTRECVLALGREWGLRVSERQLGMTEILAARERGVLQEIFGCGTAAVIAPVGAIGYRGQHLPIGEGRMGPLARRLYDEITGIQYGKIEDRHGWTVLVD